MPYISMQLHAHPDELLKFSYDSAKKYNLLCCVFAGHPSTPTVIVNYEDLLQIYQNFIGSGSKFEFVFALVQNPLDLIDTNDNNFQGKHPDTVRIAIGKLKENTLEESWLSFKSDNENTYKIAKKIANDLKKITKAGSRYYNSHGSGHDRNHRYTEYAKKLNINGCKMLTSGSALYDFSDLNS